MNNPLQPPNPTIAAAVVTAMTNEEALSTTRMTTGDQYFVFAITTTRAEYVIRMTDAQHKKNFISAIDWQKKLIPLGIPLAKFIHADLEGQYSPFPALLMMRLPGDDLCNIYSDLSASDKNNLAKEMVKIQSATDLLPDGLGYGILSSYDHITEDKSWYDFLINRLRLFLDIIKKNAVFDPGLVMEVIAKAQDIEEELRKIRARPFLWDASERNVIVYQGKISGIVDVDDMCFGDPLFVIALTYTALENEGYDTLYPDYWAENLQLDESAQRRLAFYRLFYAIVFMRKHSMTTTNNQKINFDTLRLKAIFQQALTRMKKFDV
ncbi:MAG: aminoglycoside phosphotransferase family protein [Gammaproteobacteria bacterium]|nr:aminoglycoside phosphotransferase family protein [Gammaproteobacteria bacterium]